MNPLTIIAFVTLSCFSLASGEGFCYEGDCAPGTAAWGDACKGPSQSPIDLPLRLPFGTTSLKLRGAYAGPSFKMTNSGHSVTVEIPAMANKIFTFPDPLQVQNTPSFFNPNANVKGNRNYKFASMHFHWGEGKIRQGSEHCVMGNCAAGEAHFVHYLAQYNSLNEAVASGDPNALTVVGVLLDSNGLANIAGKFGYSDPSLAPIIANLKSVAEPTTSVTVNSPIDFTSLLTQNLIQKVYTYKGSLTTPGCNQQVNWFVLMHSSKVPNSDMDALRSQLKDSHHKVMNKNYRPRQPLNNRQVQLSLVSATY